MIITILPLLLFFNDFGWCLLTLVAVCIARSVNKRQPDTKASVSRVQLPVSLSKSHDAVPLGQKNKADKGRPVHRTPIRSRTYSDCIGGAACQNNAGYRMSLLGSGYGETAVLAVYNAYPLVHVKDAQIARALALRVKIG